MKMLIAIIHDDNIDPLLQALTTASFRVTRVASTGGFFRKGSVTLLVGLEDERVEAALTILRQQTKLISGEEKRATVFVVPVTHYEQI